jgi:hypothetical protein
MRYAMLALGAVLALVSIAMMRRAARRRLALSHRDHGGWQQPPPQQPSVRRLRRML